MGAAAYLVFAINGVTSANATDWPRSSRAVVAPVGTPLPVRTIARHMSRISADTADDVGGIILLLRAIVLAVADLAAVLACLVLVVAQSSVQGGKLAKLIPLELVLALGDRGSLEKVG